MIFETFTVGALGANCYILAKDDIAVCIDPGGDAEELDKFLATNGLSLEAVINTHAHHDHIGANAFLSGKYECPVYIHVDDLKTLENTTSNLSVMFGEEHLVDYEVKEMEDAQVLELGGLDFKVIHTPGHTSGSVCLQQNGNLFTGDTLFYGSIGRTDLPTSDPKAMQRSLALLKRLPADLKVFPGHGPSSVMENELKDNPYL